MINQLSEENLRDLVELKELQIGALMEITQAINDNLAEKSLYKIYQFLLLANLRIKKMALFAYDEKWECKVNFGTRRVLYDVPLPDSYIQLVKETYLGPDDLIFGEFNIALPVYHKSKLLGIVLIGDSDYLNPANENQENTVFFKTLTNIIMVAIENKKLARKQREQEAYKRELEIARQVQQNLIPQLKRNYPGVELSAFYAPNKDVGGDYYDFFEVGRNRYMVCIADVSGKGVPAALIMSNFQASLRALSIYVESLRDIVPELNRLILERGKGELFITVFLGFLDLNYQEFEYVNCGHNPPIICSENQIKELKQGTTILGVFDELPFIKSESLTLNKDDVFVGYTDGIVETENSKNEDFGEERVKKIVQSAYQDSVEKLNDRLIFLLDEFREGIAYRDDVTLLSFKIVQ